MSNDPKPPVIIKDCLEGLRALYVAVRDNHQGKLPPPLQSAYEKAGSVLQAAVANGQLDIKEIRRA